MQLQHHAIKSLLISCLCAVFLAVSGFAAKAESNTASEIQTPSDAESSTAAVVTDPSAWPTLWVVGDSTAAEFADTAYYSPRYGWGTQLGNYFQNIHIRNLAVSGTIAVSSSCALHRQFLWQPTFLGRLGSRPLIWRRIPCFWVIDIHNCLYVLRSSWLLNSWPAYMRSCCGFLQEGLQ